MDARPARGLDDLPVPGLEPAVAYVLPYRVGEEEDVLLHDPDPSAERGQSYVPDVDSVDQDGSGRRLVESGNEPAEGGLSAARGSDDRQRLSRPDPEIHAPEDADAGVVGERNVPELDVAAYVHEIHGLRSVAGLRFDPHELDEALETRHAGRVLLEKGDQLPDGNEECVHIEGEGHEVAVVHRPGHDERAARGDHEHVEHAGREIHAPVEASHGPEEPAPGFAIPPRAVLELADLEVLVGEGLGHPDARDAALQIRVDERRLFLDLHRRLREDAALACGEHNDDGYDDGEHQGEFQADEGHGDEGTRQGDEGDEQIFRPVVRQFHDLEQVAHHPGHEVPGSRPVVEAERELLEMGEQVAADVRFHAYAQEMAPVGHDVLEEGADAESQKAERHDGDEGAEGPGGNQVLERVPGDEGEGEVDERYAEGAGDVEGEQPQVGPVVAQEQRELAAVGENGGFHGDTSAMRSAPMCGGVRRFLLFRDGVSR